MTRFTTHSFAAVVAVLLAATSFAAVTAVPPQPQLAVAAAPMLA